MDGVSQKAVTCKLIDKKHKKAAYIKTKQERPYWKSEVKMESL